MLSVKTENKPFKESEMSDDTNSVETHQPKKTVNLDHKEKTFLQAVYERRSDDIFLLLKKQTVNVNCLMPKSSISCLHLLSNNYDIIKPILERYKPNVNTLDLMKCTPLHYAVWNGNYKVSKCLIKFGANVNIRDMQGETPVFFAVRVGSKKLIQLMLRSGAKLSLRNRQNMSILDIVAKKEKEISKEIMDVMDNYLLRKMKRWRLMMFNIKEQLKGIFDVKRKNEELESVKTANDDMRKKIKEGKDCLSALDKVKAAYSETISKMEEAKDILTKRLELACSAHSFKSPFQKKKNFSRQYLFEKNKSEQLKAENEKLKKALNELRKSKSLQKKRLLSEKSKLKKDLDELTKLYQRSKRKNGTNKRF